MDHLVTWLIVALFYAPLHYLIPLLVAVMRSPDAAGRKLAIRGALIDCSLSMGLAFTLVIWLAREHLTLAMGILLLSMAAPYVRVLYTTSRPEA